MREKLDEVARASLYRLPDSKVTVVLSEKPWGTHYRVKAYVKESRDQYLFTSDLTARGKAMLIGAGIKPAYTPLMVSDGR